jgi:putative tricarboxylic transport membrane protein
MSDPSREPADADTEGDGVRNRWPEVGVALVLQGLAVLVILDSLRVGTGWADDGPRSGYFPFWIGVFLFAAASAILIGELRRWREVSPVFAEHAQLKLVWAIFLPMVIYVSAIAVIGIYIASFALIVYFMIRHGRYRVPASVAVAAGVPLFFFLVFERWFLVQLPKGPIEQLLGF